MNLSRRAVSRDARALFLIVLVSTATLWGLARLRFPDQVSAVPPVLAQLAPVSALDDIAATANRVTDRIGSMIVSVPAQPVNALAGGRLTRVSALRYVDDLAILPLEDPKLGQATRFVGAPEIARDRAARLAVIRLPPADVSPLPIWSPRRPAASRFLVAVRATPSGVSVQPLFVGSMRAVVTPIWLDAVWELPDIVDAAPGTFVFTVDGAFAGLVVEKEGGRALVPGHTVLARAQALAAEGMTNPGVLGIEVAALTPQMAAATGARFGVVITWVDPQGPAATSLRVADVVEAVDGNPSSTTAHWSARVDRLSAGESVTLTVYRGAERLDVRLSAARPRIDGPGRVIGLGLETIRGRGAAVTQVAADSAAQRAGLIAGDVITLVGSSERPTAAQALRAFSRSPADRPVLVGFERGRTHHLVAVERTW
jgi:hypothetical protein